MISSRFSNYSAYFENLGLDFSLKKLLALPWMEFWDTWLDLPETMCG